MKVGDKARIKDEAWFNFLHLLGEERKDRLVTDPQSVAAVNPTTGEILLTFPLWWWKEDDLILLSEPEESLPKVISLDEHRIRAEEEFKDEQVAYVEVLWGKKTYAFNAAVRNLEEMRRGEDDGSLRAPETHHEALHLILHVRALANDMARHFGMVDMVRESDDLPNRK